MMTKAEASAFIDNPGRIGIWKFQNVRFEKLHNSNRYRKWDGDAWYVGSTSVNETDAEAISWSIKEPSVLTNLDNMIMALQEGFLPSYVCNLDGNVVPSVFEPEQLGLFE